MVLACAALLTLAAAAPPPAAEPDTAFAGYLYRAGEWEMAALEYMRVIYLRGDTLSVPLPALRLARCWQELDRPGDALTLYRRLSAGVGDGDTAAMASLGAGSVLEGMGMDREARGLFLTAAAQAEDPELEGTGRVLAALSAGRRGEWGRAESELEGVARGPVGPLAEGLLSDVRRAQSLPRRSPVACAGASAVLPGLGQTICGRPGDGLNALLTTAATGLLLYHSLEEESVAGSVLSGWLFLSFYGGNVYGGYRSAESFNRTRRRRLYESIAGRIARWRGR
ncbi:MAG: tetratricopeptide repeat protein [Candidatus Fermentibacterota bacterium]